MSDAKPDTSTANASTPGSSGPAGASAADSATRPSASEGAAASPTSAEAELAKATRQLEEANARAVKMEDHYKRALADLENYRRRAAREKEEIRKFAADALLEELLPALDALRLGLQSARQHADTANLTQGFQMVAELLRTTLEKHGLKEVNPEGQPFNPGQHESVAQQPHPQIPEGNVSQVLRVGYTLHERVLRPASVILSTGPAS